MVSVASDFSTGEFSLAKKNGRGGCKEKGAKNKILVQSCLCMNSGKDEWCSELYMVDLDEDVAIKHSPHSPFGPTSMVALGSVIYLIGGNPPKPPQTTDAAAADDDDDDDEEEEIHSYTGVSYLDLSKPAVVGWESAPPLKSLNRYILTPDCVALCGKIYVFRFQIVEVFDPKHNQWDQLLPPPGLDNFDLFGPVVADPSNNRIFFRYQPLESLYAYYPEAQPPRCELVAADFNFWCFSLLAFQNGVIYFYECSSLHKNVLSAAYDVAAKQWLNLVFSSEFDNEIWHLEFDALVNLGDGIMCLASHYYPSRANGVYTVKFRVERTSARDVLVTTISARSHTVDKHCYFANYLPLS